jgi:Uma2 family endonuclease
MAMPAMQMEANLPVEDPSGEPASEKRLAWETLRERDLEEKMGQGAAHGRAVKLFIDASTALREEQRREGYIGWDVFVEWDPNDPRARVSPDMFLLEGQPASISPSIWQTWRPGCEPPVFAMEIVSKKSRAKDHDHNPMRYAALGTDELAIFDPEPHGDEAFRLQVFRRTPRGQFLRVYAGPGPAESKVLRAWLVAVDGGAHVRLARNADGTDLVLTAEEQVRVERERVSALEARLRELEARLATSR